MASPLFDPSQPAVYFGSTKGEYGFMSNWYLSPFHSNGLKFNSSEHYMMFWKAFTFDDKASANQILAEPSPAKAQKIGRKIRGFTKDRWANVSQMIVEKGLKLKFETHSELRAKLLATGDAQLVEATSDRIWGIGFQAANAEANRQKWGENRLGLALMNVRKLLREADRKAATNKLERQKQAYQSLLDDKTTDAYHVFKILDSLRSVRDEKGDVASRGIKWPKETQ